MPRKEKKEKEEKNEKINVSIIIPACNEEKYIASCLNSLTSQTQSGLEVVIVCNGCTDSTEKVIESLIPSLPLKVKKISQNQRNVSLARNKGALNSTNPLLIFLDADTQLTKNSIAEIIKTNSPIGVCKGRFNSQKLIAKITEKVKNSLWRLVWSNGIIFCSREMFNSTSGFDETITKGETGEFIKRAKHLNNNKFKRANTHVITSARRLEKWGYLGAARYWIKERLFPTKKEYPLIR